MLALGNNPRKTKRRTRDDIVGDYSPGGDTFKVEIRDELWKPYFSDKTLIGNRRGMKRIFVALKEKFGIDPKNYED